jgi:hypothetical protein
MIVWRLHIYSLCKYLDWANHRLIGTQNSSFDGEIVQIRDYAVDNLKTYVALPTQITISYS